MPIKMGSNQPFASSRYLLWAKPPSYPFFDIIHRDTDPGEVFDLNIDLNSYDGSVYIKTQDIVEMGRTIGMLTKDEADKLRAENAELRRQMYKLPAVQEELKSGLDDLVAKFFASLNSVDSEPDNTEPETPSDIREPAEAESTPVRPFDF